MSLNNSEFETIETERLVLRKFSIGDINDMLKNWISDIDVQSEYGEPIYTERHTVEELLKKWVLQYRWAIIHKESNENIGHISFCRLYEDFNTAEVEYCIGKAFWNKGFVTEAIEAFISYTFINTPITKLEAFHRIENPASGAVLVKAGMKPVETVMRFYSESMKPSDGYICYAISNNEWQDKYK